MHTYTYTYTRANKRTHTHVCVCVCCREAVSHFSASQAHMRGKHEKERDVRYDKNNMCIYLAILYIEEKSFF